MSRPIPGWLRRLLTPSLALLAGRAAAGEGARATPASTIRQLVTDGAWTWFGDPRAICLGSSTVIGWVDRQGDIRVGQLEHATGALQTTVLHRQLEIDDHDNPSLLVRPDGRLQAFYCRHASSPLLTRTTLLPGDASAWGPETSLLVDFAYTYPNPIVLPEEGNRYFLFWRGADFKPAMATSSNGVTWSAKQMLIEAGEGTVAYVKQAASGRRIHFAFTNNHPESTPNTNIYHAYYEAGMFYRADGTVIRSEAALPLQLSECDKVYDSVAQHAGAWIWDIAIDAEQRPVIAFATFKTSSSHFYHWARWNGTSWIDRELCDAGGSIEASGDDPYYSAGIILDPESPNRFYLCRPQVVGGPWELERWVSLGNGATFTSHALTNGEYEKNMRPVVPRRRNEAYAAVLWMRGPYFSYTSYSTDLAVLAFEPTDVAMLPAPTVFLSPSWPNPFRGSTTLPIQLTAATSVSVGVYDVRGRRVRLMRLGTLPAGEHRAVWDGTDESGIAVANGTYYCRLESNAAQPARAVTLLR